MYFIIPLDLSPHYLEILKASIREAKESSDIVIVSAHVGPHYRTSPSKIFRNFAHKIIDLGADVYFGTSNHIPQGVEVYKGKLIIYDAGDFVDDYAVDQYEFFSNDQSFIFVLEVSKNFVLRVEMIPTVVRNMQAKLATNEEARNMMESMKILCEELETKAEINEKSLLINISRQ